MNAEKGIKRKLNEKEEEKSCDDQHIEQVVKGCIQSIIDSMDVDDNKNDTKEEHKGLDHIWMQTLDESIFALSQFDSQFECMMSEDTKQEPIGKSVGFKAEGDVNKLVSRSGDTPMVASLDGIQISLAPVPQNGTQSSAQLLAQLDSINDAVSQLRRQLDISRLQLKKEK